jgi:hypothetical protein
MEQTWPVSPLLNRLRGTCVSVVGVSESVDITRKMSDNVPTSSDTTATTETGVDFIWKNPEYSTPMK